MSLLFQNHLDLKHLCSKVLTLELFTVLPLGPESQYSEPGSPLICVLQVDGKHQDVGVEFERLQVDIQHLDLSKKQGSDGTNTEDLDLRSKKIH